MTVPTIHVTAAYRAAEFYPHCPGSGVIARAIKARSFSHELLGALQSIGVVVIVDGEVAPDLTPANDGGLEHIGDVIARHHLRNHSTGE